MREQFENPTVAAARSRAGGGRRAVPFFLNNGTFAPLSAAPRRGDDALPRVRAPDRQHLLARRRVRPRRRRHAVARTTVDADLRKYLRLGSAPPCSPRASAASSPPGTTPTSSTSAATWSCGATPTCRSSGNQGFFAQRWSCASPSSTSWRRRSASWARAGHAVLRDRRRQDTGARPYQFSAPSDPGVSYVNDPVFGEPVSGFHLVDGRASYGIGLQFFFLGYPLHFDWSKLTDLQGRLSTAGSSTSGSGSISSYAGVLHPGDDAPRHHAVGDPLLAARSSPRARRLP